MGKKEALKKISDFFVENFEEFHNSGLAFFVVAGNLEENQSTAFVGGKLQEISTAIAYRMSTSDEIATAVAYAVEVVDSIRDHSED